MKIHLLTKEQLGTWLKEKNDLGELWRGTKWRFVKRMPDIGELCLVKDRKSVLFCRRTSQNYLSSAAGNMPFASTKDATMAMIGGGTTIPFDRFIADDFITIELVEEEKCEDATSDQQHPTA